MDYVVIDESPVRKKITVTATPEEVGQAMDAVAAKYRRDAKLDGFRRGKAPLDMVSKLFRKEIYNEALQTLQEKQAFEALQALALKPISHARFDGGEMKRGAPFEYSFSFDVMPDVTLPGYEGMRVEQEEVAVAPEEVDAFIERLRNNLATQKPIQENRPPRPGEAAIIDFEVFDENGKPIASMQAKDMLFLVGRTEELKDLDELVRTLAPGQEKTGDVSFPSTFPNPDVAGRTLSMKVKVVNINEHLVPPLDDAMAKQAGGHDTVEKMREAIETSFVTRRTQAAKETAMARMMDTLLKETEFTLPEALVEEQAMAYLNDLGERLARSGKSPAELGKTFGELRAAAVEKARQTVKSEIVLAKIAEKEGVEVTDAELDQRIRLLAERMAQHPLAFRAQCEKDGSLDLLRHQIKTDKTIEAVYNKANVEFVPFVNREAAEAVKTGDDAPAGESEA